MIAKVRIPEIMAFLIKENWPFFQIRACRKREAGMTGSLARSYRVELLRKRKRLSGITGLRPGYTGVRSCAKRRHGRYDRPEARSYRDELLRQKWKDPVIPAWSPVWPAGWQFWQAEGGPTWKAFRWTKREMEQKIGKRHGFLKQINWFEPSTKCKFRSPLNSAGFLYSIKPEKEGLPCQDLSDSVFESLRPSFPFLHRNPTPKREEDLTCW
jgi:hypothetical protein